MGRAALGMELRGSAGHEPTRAGPHPQATHTHSLVPLMAQEALAARTRSGRGRSYSPGTPAGWTRTQRGLSHSLGPLRAHAHRRQPGLTVPTHNPGPLPAPHTARAHSITHGHSQLGPTHRLVSEPGHTHSVVPLITRPTHGPDPLTAWSHSQPEPAHSPNPLIAQAHS